MLTFRYLDLAYLKCEQVTFFLPQLVQLLRSDEQGMIKNFLLASAHRTIVFAHHLVCTLKVGQALLSSRHNYNYRTLIPVSLHILADFQTFRQDVPLHMLVLSCNQCLGILDLSPCNVSIASCV